jgi:hypothetical protein
MNDTPELLAFIDLSNIQGSILWVIRGVAAVVGAVFGWFLSGPLWKGLYRLAFQRAIPGSLLPMLRLGGAALAAVLVFFFLPLGGGGGWGGWGPGEGPGPGPGPGNGQAKNTTQPDKVVNNNKDSKAASAKKDRELMDIEILGGERVQEEKYYLVKRQEPPFDLDEVEYFLKDKTNLEVRIIMTENSAGVGQGAQSPLAKLRDVLNKYRIPNLEKKE